MTTNGEFWKQHAERKGIPRVTLASVKDGLAQAKKQGSDAILARLMIKAGRLTDEARAYVLTTYPQE